MQMMLWSMSNEMVVDMCMYSRAQRKLEAFFAYMRKCCVSTDI